MTNRLFNFSAGPATLPVSVLEQAQNEMLNYKGSGMSVMEMSHRSKEFTEIIENAEADLRQLMGINDDYSVLFLQGGASLQFSMIPLNLAKDGDTVNVVNTGSWSKKAIKELKRHVTPNIVASSEDKNFSYIPNLPAGALATDAAYSYITSNNTIFGTQYKDYPDTGSVPLVADMSSDILCKPVDVSKFGLIFAGAQKNIGPSGVTIVIVRNDLIDRAPDSLPTMLQYRTHADAKSLYNTPPTYGIYIAGLVFKGLLESGGLAESEVRNERKASKLYDAIDSSDFYYCPTDSGSRSTMNVVFRITGDNEDLEAKFIKDATAAGLSGLKGHRSVGGLRASIYNAHPEAGVDALIAFMDQFQTQNGV